MLFNFLCEYMSFTESLKMSIVEKGLCKSNIIYVKRYSNAPQYRARKPTPILFLLLFFEIKNVEIKVFIRHIS